MSLGSRLAFYLEELQNRLYRDLRKETLLDQLDYVYKGSNKLDQVLSSVLRDQVSTIWAGTKMGCSYLTRSKGA
jgi:hypothetical protein